MRIKNITRRAETLIEVVISIFVISVAGVASLTLLGSSRVNNDNIATRTIALNLAREGLEAVRTVRDSNWQRYSSNPTYYYDCLDTFPDETDARVKCDFGDNNDMWQDLTTPADDVEDSYIAYFDDNFVWTLERMGGLDLQPDSPFCETVPGGNYCDYSLRKYTCNDDAATVADNIYRDYGLYNHTAATFDPRNVLSCAVAPNVDGYGTDFFREIKFTEHETSSILDADNLPYFYTSVWRVDASVKWIENGEVKSADLTTYLTNYIPEIKDRSSKINT